MFRQVRASEFRVVENGKVGGWVWNGYVCRLEYETHTITMQIECELATCLRLGAGCRFPSLSPCFVRFEPMVGENRQLVSDEPVEFEK